MQERDESEELRRQAIDKAARLSKTATPPGGFDEWFEHHPAPDGMQTLKDNSLEYPTEEGIQKERDEAERVLDEAKCVEPYLHLVFEAPPEDRQRVLNEILASLGLDQ